MATRLHGRGRVILRGPVLSPADWSSLFHAKRSSLRGFLMVVDTVLERAEVGLSNTASTSAWKAHSGEWLRFGSELEFAGLMSAADVKSH